MRTDQTPHLDPYSLVVSQLGGKPVRYKFDQSRVLVGRGVEADLRVEHAGFSRMQFLIERGVGSAGEARFRITPFEVTNPTFVNGRPAVEGTLTPGDVIAVTDVRLMLEHRAEKRERAREVKSEGLSPVRIILFTLLAGMTVFVAYLFMADQEEEMPDVATGEIKLFEAGRTPPVHCDSPTECDHRAHDAYAKARKYQLQAGADPGNHYRAALEYDRAAKLRELSGKPLSDISDVDARVQEAKSRAETEFNDARFRLGRAIANHDNKRCASEADYIAKILPDDHHPYRIKLDAYRRTLSKGENP